MGNMVGKPVGNYTNMGWKTQENQWETGGKMWEHGGKTLGICGNML